MALVASSLHHRQNASKQSVKKSKYHVIMLISAQFNLLQRGPNISEGVQILQYYPEVVGPGGPKS